MRLLIQMGKHRKQWSQKTLFINIKRNEFYSET